MNTSPTNNLRKNIAGVCLVAAPLVLLAGDAAARLGTQWSFAHVFTAKLAFALFAPALLALMHLLRERADKTGLAGGGLALMGLLSGSAIVTFWHTVRALSSLDFNESAVAAMGSAMENEVFGLTFLYPLAGVFFPLGLLVLSVGLFRARVAAPHVAAMLAVGAILFPVGRIGGSWAAIFASDIFLTAALGLIGWRILKWTTSEWERVPASGAETAARTGATLASY